jgi:hypothetical protein
MEKYWDRKIQCMIPKNDSEKQYCSKFFMAKDLRGTVRGSSFIMNEKDKVMMSSIAKEHLKKQATNRLPAGTELSGFMDPRIAGDKAQEASLQHAEECIVSMNDLIFETFSRSQVSQNEVNFSANILYKTVLFTTKS